MKNTILTFILFFSINCNAQNFNYKIKVQGVENIVDAKSITDPLRYKFDTFPAFNEETKCFEFVSDLNISQTEIIELLSQHGYLLESSLQEVIIRNLIIEE